LGFRFRVWSLSFEFGGRHFDLSDPLFLSSPKIKDVMLEFMKGQPVSTTRIALAPIKFVPLGR
jgi:hypothetical protein